MDTIKLLIKEWESESKLTRKMLERLPANQLGFKPHAKSMTLSGLAMHIASVPGWSVDIFDKEVLDMQPYKNNDPKTVDEILLAFDKGSAELKNRLETTDESSLEETWTFKMAGKTILSLPRIVVVRSFLLSHLIHHRAQLSVYLRMLDVAVPGMYGPSADET